MRRRLMDRKIVELLIGGAGVNSISRTLHVSKRRVRRLREQAKEYGYLTEQGSKGPVELTSYPEALFPDPVDARSLRVSEAHELLEPHRAWVEERLRAGWHAVTVFEELPLSVSRSSFYRYLERSKLNRIGESARRVVPEIVHGAGEALLVDWGKLREVNDPQTGRKKTLWMFIGVLGFSVKGVKSALGSLVLVREKVGLEKASFYLDQPRTTRNGKPAFSARSKPPTARSTNSSTNSTG